jgi:hypothetical protein
MYFIDRREGRGVTKRVMVNFGRTHRKLRINKFLTDFLFMTSFLLAVLNKIVAFYPSLHMDFLHKSSQTH